MRKKLLLGALIGLLIMTGWCFHKRLFGDDEKRIREIITQMEKAAENKNTQGIIEHFSSDYSDSGGHNKFIILQMMKRFIDSLDDIRIDVKDLDVLVAGDRAYATMKVTSQATKRGRVISPFGSDNDPETPRVTFERTSTGDWKIIKVENVDSPSF